MWHVENIVRVNSPVSVVWESRWTETYFKQLKLSFVYTRDTNFLSALDMKTYKVNRGMARHA